MCVCIQQPTVLDFVEAAFDVMFIIDLCLNFGVAIRGYDGRLIRNYKVIAANYHARGFWLDLFTSLPFSLIIIITEITLRDAHDVDILATMEVMAMVKVRTSCTYLWRVACV